jgi:dihydroneopterin aldolase / 2-amino-4-hydroxy-6-hydroxymethyldihydropteridine diphosphokinase
VLDTIEIRGLRVVGIVGALDEERTRPQPFEIDLDIETDIRQAGATDDLAATLNYAEPTLAAELVIKNEGHILLERVATRIAEEVLRSPKVVSVGVVVRKLQPPLPHDMTSTAVRIHRTRSHLSFEPRKRVRAYIALGSNLGDRRAHLRRAIHGLPDTVAISNVYETDPVGTTDDSGRYLNMVVALDTDLDPFALLALCRRLENDAGRVRTYRNAPRELDVDVLLYAGVRIESDELTIPHPRMWERRFVMAPLADVGPEVVSSDWNDRLPVDGVQQVEALDLT